MQDTLGQNKLILKSRQSLMKNEIEFDKMHTSDQDLEKIGIRIHEEQF
jgi:hypothetical protein